MPIISFNLRGAPLTCGHRVYQRWHQSATQTQQLCTMRIIIVSTPLETTALEVVKTGFWCVESYCFEEPYRDVLL